MKTLTPMFALIAIACGVRHADGSGWFSAWTAAPGLRLSASMSGATIAGGATTVPRVRNRAWTNAMEQQRLALNDWIGHRAKFDGVFDFDALLQGPANPKNEATTIVPQWSCFKGVHANLAGYAAMSASIDLSLLQSTGSDSASIQLVPGSTTPLIQLNGENFQISANGTYFTTFTNSRTLSTSGVVGTDLGYPITLPDKIVFLFGDTFGAYQSGGKYFQSPSVGPNGADDSVAYIPNVDLSQCHYIGDVAQQLAQGVTNPNVSFGACPALHYYANSFHPATQHSFQAIQVSGLLPGEGEGPFRVPTAGLAYNNRLYMFYITEYQNTPAGTPHFSLQSILARSDQDPESWSDTNPPTFTRLYTVSSHPAVADPANPPAQAGDGGQFMFNPPVVMDAATLTATGLRQGLPAAIAGAPSVAFVFGSSYQYNRSNLYLAVLSLSDIEAGTSKWFYYKGNGQWSNDEKDSAPLLGSSAGAAHIGNHSVVWNSALRRFVLMYNDAGVLAQFSSSPWGPWTAPVTVFSNNDAWGMKLLHHPGDQIVRSLVTVDDPGDAPHDYGSDPGVAYSPNLLDKFKQNADGSVTVYYTLSTWNPYETFVMSTTFTSSTAPVIGIVANAEGEKPIIAPNTWVEVKGSNLAPVGDERIWQGSDFMNNQMPKQLDGVSVTVNGNAAYVYYVSPTQVNVLTPPDALSGPVQVVVTNGGNLSAAFTAQAQMVSPSFFVFNGGPYVAATHANGSLLGPASLYPGSTTPAQPAETVVLYANGFGATSTPVVGGSVLQSGSLATLPVIKIGGTAATVQFAGLVSPGQFQFNVTVPLNTPDGDQPITATYNGFATQAGTLITVRH